MADRDIERVVDTRADLPFRVLARRAGIPVLNLRDPAEVIRTGRP